jgi:hypothetical protein
MISARLASIAFWAKDWSSAWPVAWDDVPEVPAPDVDDEGLRGVVVCAVETTVPVNPAHIASAVVICLKFLFITGSIIVSSCYTGRCKGGFRKKVNILSSEQ